MDKTISQRNTGLDILRILACYMVVQVHTGEFFYIGEGGTVINGSDAEWVNLYNSLARSAVPLFIMISGFFLLPVKEKTSDFFKKRFTRVAIPFIVWCILYSVYQLVRGQVDLSAALLNLLKIPVNFGVDIGHLWYIYMLIGLYLVAPVVSPWLQTASRKTIELYLSLWGMTLFIPYIHLIYPEIWGECFWNQTPMLYYFSGYLGYMILAFYIKKYGARWKTWNIPAGILLILIGYTITAQGFSSRLETARYIPDLELTWGYGTINVAMMALGLFLLLKDVRFRNPDTRTSRIITDISKLTFGIYLIHIMILNFFYGTLNEIFPSAMVKIPVIAVCTFILSYAAVKLLSFIPKSKYLIG